MHLEKNMMNNKNYLYSFYVGTGVILLTVILMKLNIVSDEFSAILLGITIGWYGATGFLRYLYLLDEKRTLVGKSKKIFEDIKNSIPTKKS
ncbi:hypothetical protein HYT02_05760 [Candidatus Gottesmanbacteria bacterium]|nr:hypothetical protein [Candidatus Gottesmanbacteria bacterium]